MADGHEKTLTGTPGWSSRCRCTCTTATPALPVPENRPFSLGPIRSFSIKRYKGCDGSFSTISVDVFRSWIRGIARLMPIVPESEEFSEQRNFSLKSKALRLWRFDRRKFSARRSFAQKNQLVTFNENHRVGVIFAPPNVSCSASTVLYRG